MVVNGTLVWYYHICKRQVWLMGRGIEPVQEHEYVQEGKSISEVFFKRFVNNKEIEIDNHIKIDLMKGKVVIEVKKSSKFIQASKMQVLFYLYYLKNEKGINARGILAFPEERRRIEVVLDKESEREIAAVIDSIEEIVNLPSPPPPVRIRFCRNCAYKEMCWA